MKVKMLVGMAGPDECWKPGDEREVSEATALEWAAAGIATVLPEGEIVVHSEAALEATEGNVPKKGRRGK